MRRYQPFQQHHAIAVEAIGRLVEQPQRRIGRQHPRQACPLLLPGREDAQRHRREMGDTQPVERGQHRGAIATVQPGPEQKRFSERQQPMCGFGSPNCEGTGTSSVATMAARATESALP